ncbi:MAG: phage holin family protein [Clostridiales bacterium]|nr:phage holin family protein [Clostridiales bacterium]
MKEFLQNSWTWLMKAVVAVAGGISGLFGGWNPVLTVLVILMGMDYGTGLLVGIMNKSLKTPEGGLDSKVGAKGILKKVLILCGVLLGVLLDQALGGGKNLFRDMVAWFYVANEGLSVIENLALADVVVPKKLRDFLEQTKEKADQGKEEKP